MMQIYFDWYCMFQIYTSTKTIDTRKYTHITFLFNSIYSPIDYHFNKFIPIIVIRFKNLMKFKILNYLFFKKSSRAGLNESTKTPASRHLTPCNRPEATKKPSPADKICFLPATSTSNLPAATKVLCECG